MKKTYNDQAKIEALERQRMMLKKSEAAIMKSKGKSSRLLARDYR